MFKGTIGFLTFILLLATHFFRLEVLPATRLIAYAMLAFMLVSAYQFYNRKDAVEKCIIYYTVGCFISYIFSVFVNNQPAEPLLLAYEQYFAVLSYFMIKRFQPSVRTIHKVLLYIGILASISYLIQWTVYPKIIFSSASSITDIREDEFRMRFVCTLSFMLLWFYGLNQYFTNNNIKSLIYSLLGIVPQIVMGFRSLLGLLVAGTILMVFFCSKKLQNYFKYAIVIVVIGYGALQVPLVQDKIEEMTARQESQTFANDDYVRVLGMAFYEDYFEENWIMRVVGGGIPMISYTGPLSKSNPYEVDMYQADSMGLKWNDLGLLGLSYMIGTPTVLFLIILCIMCMWQCKAKELQWVRFAIAVSMLGTIVTSAELYRFGNLLLLGVLLYYVKIYNYQKMKSNRLNHENRNTNISLRP